MERTSPKRNHSSEPEKQLTRKRTRNSNKWKQNVRKTRRQAGLDYKDVKGKLHAKKSVKGQCNCRMKCSLKISNDHQQAIHANFWNLGDHEKNHFYGKFVERSLKSRSRPRALPQPHPDNCFKQYALKYFFQVDDNRIQVCKSYFLNTLDISSHRISYFFKNIYQNTGTPKSAVRGKHTKKVTASAEIDKIKEHINSFPRMASHYCRANTNKEYLEHHLSLNKMYSMYKEKYPESKVKMNVYRKIFNTNLNIAFFKPKKDRCDFCEEIKNNPMTTEKRRNEYENHMKEKEESKKEKDIDKKLTGNESTAVISFDLQNVFSLPKANVSNFFYKRKFNVYNLTAYCSINKKTYCAVWHEMVSGRAGNHICSSLIKILKKIITEFPKIEKIVIWSDSCIPQNRNSIMSFGLYHFLKTFPNNIKSIEQKFSEPGHSNIQEIDAVHSMLEKKFRYTEIYSPISLLRNLNHVANSTKKFIVIEMNGADFIDYQKYSKIFAYNTIPYSKVKYLLINNTSYIAYKTSVSGEILNVRLNRNTRNRKKDDVVDTIHINTLPPISTKPVLEAKKKADLQSMLKYMPEIDRKFYEVYIK